MNEASAPIPIHPEPLAALGAPADRGSSRSAPLSVHLRKIRVEVVEGPDRGLHVELGDQPILIGRAPDCGLPLTDGSVSWLHAELTLVVGGVQVRNLGSRNGVQVGASLVEESRVAPGTCILVGRTVLSLQLSDEEAELPLAALERFGGLSGRTLVMKMVFGRLTRYAAGDAPILIEGPSGTGKQLAARALHERSPRAGGPYIVLDCAGTPRHLMEGELFGITRGAGSGADAPKPGIFERAAGGTVVLDEISELPTELQPKLLSVIERGQMRRAGESHARKISARVVATTSRVLAREVQAGHFRPDLYGRLSSMRVAMPALCDRKDDIPMLVEEFLDGAAPLPGTWLRVLGDHDWPGNVSELRNMVERVRAQRAAELLPALDVGFGAGAQLPSLAAARSAFEREYLRALLSRTGHNIRRAAELAGLTRQGLYGVLARNGLRSGDAEE
ncbi:MAG: Response regulator of zinc sigma-54-dependent two-component system [Myxococcales bacterium]|nr:Response regulator of zinc sigma-54-dependent two-component system [Myxococcales bacterium]